MKSRLWPAHGDPADEGGRGRAARWEVADVEVGQRVLRVAVHGAVGAVHVLVQHAGNELRREGDDERLQSSQQEMDEAEIQSWIARELLVSG